MLWEILRITLFSNKYSVCTESLVFTDTRDIIFASNRTLSCPILYPCPWMCCDFIWQPLLPQWAFLISCRSLDKANQTIDFNGHEREGCTVWILKFHPHWSEQENRRTNWNSWLITIKEPFELFETTVVLARVRICCHSDRAVPGLPVTFQASKHPKCSPWLSRLVT